MHPIFLPIDGVTWLCRADGRQVEPLAPAPGMPHANRRISEDGTEFGFIDQDRKRLGHYRILVEAPWIETVAPPRTLPKSCTAHDLMVHEGQLIAGGQSDHGEALWVRQTDKEGPAWRVVPMPEGVGKRGKAIDGLFIRGRELIAIDNIMRPKWILVYPLDPVLNGDGVSKFKLGTHTTHERILRSVEGKDFYALFSYGMNHDSTSYYLSLIRKTDLQPSGSWGGYREQSTQRLLDELKWDINMAEIDAGLPTDLGEDPPHLVMIDAALKIISTRMETSRLNLGGMLSKISSMVFCGDYLLLALGTQGMSATNATLKETKPRKGSVAPHAAFHPIPMTTLAAVERLENPTGSDAGVYAIGPDDSGTLSYEWIAAEKMLFNSSPSVLGFEV